MESQSLFGVGPHELLAKRQAFHSEPSPVHHTQIGQWSRTRSDTNRANRPQKNSNHSEHKRFHVVLELA